MVEVIEVNNQITTQTATNLGNLSTWQITIIKGSMMHEMENCNKGNYASINNQGDEQIFMM